MACGASEKPWPSECQGILRKVLHLASPLSVPLSHHGQVNPSEILYPVCVPHPKASDGFPGSLRIKSTLLFCIESFTVLTLIQTLSNFYLSTFFPDHLTLIKQGCLAFTKGSICKSFLLFSTGHVGPLIPSGPCPASSPLKFGTSEPHFSQLAGGF